MRTKRVFGDSGANRADYAGQSIKTTEIAVKANNKIILGDWIWHYNRGWLDKRSGWHNYKNRSRVVMLFGDSHTEAYVFPTKPESDPFWTVAPDKNFTWW